VGWREKISDDQQDHERTFDRLRGKRSSGQIQAERRRRLMQVEGTLPFSLTGVLAAIAHHWRKRK